MPWTADQLKAVRDAAALLRARMRGDHAAADALFDVADPELLLAGLSVLAEEAMRQAGLTRGLTPELVLDEIAVEFAARGPDIVD